MKSYEFLPHIADIRLKIKGDCLEDLFTVAMQGMGNLIKSGACPFKEEDNELLKEKIEISSIDSTSLLIDFLSEILTHSQIDKSVYCKVKFSKINNNFVSATIFGKKVEIFDEDIKAVTYHEAEIKKDEKGIFSTIIIFDI
ncbi:archease [Candidatus Dependentiae bacterium]